MKLRSKPKHGDAKPVKVHRCRMRRVKIAPAYGKFNGQFTYRCKCGRQTSIG